METGEKTSCTEGGSNTMPLILTREQIESWREYFIVQRIGEMSIARPVNALCDMALRSLSSREAVLEGLLREAIRCVPDGLVFHEKGCKLEPCDCGAEEIGTLRARMDAALKASGTDDASQGVPEGYVLAPKDPTEAMWGGLARDVMMWLDMQNSRSPQSLFFHLDRAGTEIPQWLRDEQELKNLGHAISKGTRCVLIYKAMLAALAESAVGDDHKGQKHE